MSKVVKTIASVALPIIGTIVAPGIGTALGSALTATTLGTIGGAVGGLLGGGIGSDWNPTATVLGGVTGGAGGYFSSGGTLAGLTGAAEAGTGAATGAAGAAGTAGAATGAASTAPMTVVTNGLPSTATAASLSAAAPSAGTSALGSGIMDSISNHLTTSQIVPALLGAGNQVTTQANVDAAKEAAGIQAASVDKAIAQQQPYSEAGQAALAKIQGINADPAGYIKSSSLYSTLAADAERRLMASEAAKGRVGSGGTKAALQDRLLQIGNGLVQQDLNNLQTVANAGQTAASNTSNLLTQQGNAGAAGVIGASNAQTSGYQNQISTLLALQNLGRTQAYNPSPIMYR